MVTINYKGSAIASIQTDTGKKTLKTAGKYCEGDIEIVVGYGKLTIAEAIEQLFTSQRTGKVYTVKIPKFASNQATTCEKLDDNAGLVCLAATDTTQGYDDYEDIPLFRWYNCNYIRDSNNHAIPTAIEGVTDGYVTAGNVDVGVIQMAPYVKWDDSNADYTLLSITDSPKDGYTLWSTARYGSATYPYVIHSKYFSGKGADGLPRSLPGLAALTASYNSQITDYAKKGPGYTGARLERNTWQAIFILIKYAQKSSQAVFAGCTSYNYQYAAAVQRSEAATYFPLTKAQAANIIVGSCVSVGYARILNGNASTDRGGDNLHAYANRVRVLRIESIDDATSAVYLDVADGFNTMPVAISDTVNSEVYLSTMPWHSGATDSVYEHRDGSPGDNASGKCPYRVQGVEYAVGGYFVASDTVFEFTDAAGGKQLRVCPDGTAHSSSESVIRSSYTAVGVIAAGDYWIGDIGFDADTCVMWPEAKGSGNATGTGDYNYGGGTPAAQTIREHLSYGYLGYGSGAGASYADAWAWLGTAAWDYLAAD